MMKDIFSGYGTYLTGFALVLHGVSGLFAGAVDTNTAVQEIMEGLGLVFVRRAIG